MKLKIQFGEATHFDEPIRRIIRTRVRENGSFWLRSINQLHVFGTDAPVLPDAECLRFTASEIQVLIRQSVQNPMPQYRRSLSLRMAEAVHGFYGRSFRSALTNRPGLLKRIEAMTRAAINAAREAQNESLVDLEAGVMPEEGDHFEDNTNFEAGAK